MDDIYPAKYRLRDLVSFSQAAVDLRYKRQFQDLTLENGPYDGYEIVDFPDEDSYSKFSRVGVRQDGFNGRMPLYYVRCVDIINIAGRPYAHQTFVPGTKVLISTQILTIHPLSPIAGLKGEACYGFVYEALESFKDITQSVPVQFIGLGIYYVEVEYVSALKI